MISPRLLALAGMVSTLAGCGVQYAPQNYELMISMPTPEGVVNASGIIQARVRDSRGIEGRMVYSLVKGEAIPIRLKDGRILFMTMGRETQSWAVHAPWVDKSQRDALDAGHPVPMVPMLYPHFVIFGNLADPMTGKRAEAGIRDGMGPGYGPVRIMVRKTERQPKDRIVSILPWIPSLKESLHGGIKCGNGTIGNPPCMGARDFKKDWGV